MTQILDSLPAKHSSRILCCYVNATSRVQIARITNVANWYFERVVFPSQRLLFEAPPDAQLEIHQDIPDTATVSDQIPCRCLRVYEGGNTSPEPTFRWN